MSNSRNLLPHFLLSRVVAIAAIFGGIGSAALAADDVLSGFPNDLDEGLVAFYPLEGSAIDQSGNGLDGTVNNAAFVPTVFGTGLQTTGSLNSYVEVPSNPLLSPTTGLSVSLWVDMEALPSGFASLVYKSAGTPTDVGFTDRSYSLWITSNGGIHFTSTPTGAASQITLTTPSGGILTNQFENVMGTVDCANQVMNVYINGALAGTTPYTGSSITSGNNSLRLGAPFFTLGDQTGLTGALNDVRIYNRVLSQQDISALATTAVAPASYIANFNSGIDPNLAITGTASGFSVGTSNDQLILTKDAGVTAGFGDVLSTKFLVNGDFTATVDVSAPIRHPGMSFGMGFGQGAAFYATGGDIYFAGSSTQDLIDSNLAQQGVNVPESSLFGTFMINRVGDQVTYSYNTGNGFVQTITKTAASLAVPVNLSLFLAEEGLNPTASTARFNNFQITSPNAFTLPTVPTVGAPATPLTTTIKPTGNELLVFDPSTVGGGSFHNGTINTSIPTIVLTLGFGEHIADWPTAMARQLHGGGVNCNIVVWNWSADADSGSLPLADSRVPSEGAGLGETLAATLGPSYGQSIHFIGHSLGTLVNSKAIEVLNSHIPTIRIQDTLLDEASIADNLPGAAPPSEAPAIPIDSQGRPIPVRIDNYISSFGNIYEAASNFILQSNPTPSYSTSDPRYWAEFHDYPTLWYEATLPQQAYANSSIGYAGAIEAPLFNASSSTYLPNSYAQRNTSASTPYVFQSITEAQAAQALLDRNDAEISSLDNSQLAQAITSVNYKIEGVTIFSFVGAVDTQNSILIKLVEKAGQQVPQVILAKEPSTSVPATATVAASTSVSVPTSSSYMWAPIAVPNDATFLTFDFTFHQLSQDDLLTVGINDTPVFQLENAFVTPDATENSGLLDVTQWAGQDVTLFMGLVAADDANAGGTMTIENIAFVSVPEPSALVVAVGWLTALAMRRR